MNLEDYDETMGNESIIEEKHTFKVKGVWMPVAIFFDEDLTDADKRIFGIIYLLDGKDGCYATNRYIESILGYSQKTISTGITKLENKGFLLRDFVKIKSFKNETRTLRITQKVHEYRSPYPKKTKENKGSSKKIKTNGGSSQGIGKVEASYYQIDKDNKQENSEPEGSDINSLANLEKSSNSSKRDDKSLDKSLDSLPKADRLRQGSKTIDSSPPKKIKVQYKECPLRYRPFMDAWVEITGRKFRGFTPAYKNSWMAIRMAINGIFFSKGDTPCVDKKFYGDKLTLEDWIFALERFSLMRNNADYFPVKKDTPKQLSPKTFLYNAFLPEKYTKSKSYFIECLENEPKKIQAMQLKDPDPDYTDAVVELCKKELGWDLSNGGRPTAIKCTQRLSKFFKEHKSRINDYSIHYRFPYQQIGELIAMLKKSESQEYPVKPIYLHGDLTYEKLFPAHLKHVGSL